MRLIMPTLKTERVTSRMYKAIMAEEKEVYIESIIYWLKVIMMFLPLSLKNWMCNVLVG